MALINRQAVSKLIKAFKFLIFFGALFVLYQKLADSSTEFTLDKSLDQFFSKSHTLILVLVLFMAFANWAIETIKWQLLLANLEKISFRKGFKSVLAGSSVTFINPYRSGAFLGKVLFLNSDNRVEASTLSVLGGFAQSISTLIFGIIGLLFLGSYSVFIESVDVLLLFGLMSTIILAILYFKLSIFKFILKRWEFSRKILVAFKRLSNRLKWKVLLLSMVRYIVFTLQFAILIKIAGCEGSLINIAGFVSIIYFILTMLPSFWLGNIGIRETTATMVLLGVCSNQMGIVLASLILWIVNLVLPAIAGSFFLILQKEK